MLFREALNSFFNAHKERLQAAHGVLRTEMAFDKLNEADLSAKDIDRDCARHLSLVLNKRYEEPIQSTRLGGFGWTTRHVQEDMNRYLQDKLQKANDVLRKELFK